MTKMKVVSIVGAGLNFVKLVAVEPIFKMFLNRVIVHNE